MWLNVQYEEHSMMSQLRDMEHRHMVDELNGKISQLEAEVATSVSSVHRLQLL